MKFDGGDKELNGGYKICWYYRGKGSLGYYPVLADIRLCAAAVGKDVVNPTC